MRAMTAPLGDLDQAADTAKSSAQEHGQGLADSARKSAQDVASETRQATGS